MNPRRKRFINAYLGEAQGNATQAAIIAGYSPETAGQQGHRLLKDAEIAQAVGRRLEHADIRTDAILQRLGKIANTHVEKVDAKDVISASKVILQVNGALQPKQHDSRITVNIGFLTAPQANTDSIDVTATVDTIEAQVMPPQPQIRESD